MMRGKLILVLGGSRSGKSEFAEKIAGSLGGRVFYVATATVRDKEMADRIRLHKERRPQSWKTIEEEKDVLSVLKKGRQGDVYLLDCLTVWLTNLLLESKKEAYILEQAVGIASSVKNGIHLVIVSSEVGMGIVPESPLGRIFRDMAGKVNQLFAAKADQVYFTIAGIPVEIKSLKGPEWSC